MGRPKKWLKSSKKNNFGDAKSTNVSRFAGVTLPKPAFRRASVRKTCVLRGFERATPPKLAFWQVFDGKSMNVSRFGGFLGSLACALGWAGGAGPAGHPIFTASPRAHGPSKTARFTMFCGGDPAKTRVSARFGAEIARFTWFSKGNPAKTRVLACFSSEIDECIAFWRVWGEGPGIFKILN